MVKKIIKRVTKANSFYRQGEDILIKQEEERLAAIEAQKAIKTKDWWQNNWWNIITAICAIIIAICGVLKLFQLIKGE